MKPNSTLTLAHSLSLATVTLLCAANAMAAEAIAVLDAKAPCDKPQYPRASLVNEEAGTVTLALRIAGDGQVQESKVEQSSGFKNLDKAALAAMSKCRFKPGGKDGKADSSAWLRFDYVWKLD
jgi:protein TonB